MASWDHEGIVELFRSDPGLAVELLRGPLGLDLPPFADARGETGALTPLNPAELRALTRQPRRDDLGTAGIHAGSHHGGCDCRSDGKSRTSARLFAACARLSAQA
jgi:hypothetical protein